MFAKLTFNSRILRTDHLNNRYFSVKAHNSPKAAIPLIEHYRPRWPQRELLQETKELELPNETVKREDMKFTLSANFERGKSIYYPHLSYHTGDYKIKLNVSIDKLGLSNEEKLIFCALVGPRFLSGQREVRLVVNRFSNRMENKKYATYLLETLILEAKRIYSISDNIISEELNSKVNVGETETSDTKVI